MGAARSSSAATAQLPAEFSPSLSVRKAESRRVARQNMLELQEKQEELQTKLQLKVAQQREADRKAAQLRTEQAARALQLEEKQQQIQLEAQKLKV
jgi:hypothetical protein